MSAALREVGLFRMPGRQSNINELKHAFNTGRIRLVELRYAYFPTNVHACMHTHRPVYFIGWRD